jgi:tetratricopeptide (TPR) repeat protein
MATADPANTSTRALLSVGVLVAGTALSVCTGGIGAVGLAALGSLAGNVVAGELSKVWDGRSRNPKYRHQGDDLTRLVGDSIARIFYDVADDNSLREETRGWARDLGKCVPTAWMEIARDPTFWVVGAERLPHIFAEAHGTAPVQDMPQLLSVEDSEILINQLHMRSSSSYAPQHRDVVIFGQHVRSKLFAAIQEMFLRDFSGDGRAYPALCIDTAATVLATVKELSVGQKAALITAKIQAEDLKEIKTLLDNRIQSQRDRLLDEDAPTEKELRWVFTEMRSVSKTLDDVLFTVWQIKDDTAAIRERQGQQVTKNDLQEIAAMLSAKIDASKLSQVDPLSQQLPKEILEKATLLLERGSQGQKVIAEIALGNHKAADEIIQYLKNEPISEAFDLLMLEGDNWHHAGEFDRAVEPYEKALALKPNILRTLLGAASAHSQARQGDITDHQERAIKLLEQINFAPGTHGWARIRNNLAVAWSNMPIGNRTENLQRAVRALEDALTVFNKEVDPIPWAAVQHNLGKTWAVIPLGNRSENLHKAMDYCRNAMEVYTRDATPAEWASAQNDLGNMWRNMPTGDRPANLRHAITAYENAQAVFTRETDPFGWATVQCNLGTTWATFPCLNPTENLRKAIDAYEAALTVYTKDNRPMSWAMTKNNIGNAFSSLGGPNRAQNLQMAIDAYEHALTVYTKEANPNGFAMTQNNLGVVWTNLQSGNHVENFNRAIAAFDAALTVRTKEGHPTDWASTQINIGRAWAIRNEGIRAENLETAIAAFERALTVYTKVSDPENWAKVHHNLANMLMGLAILPGKDACFLLRRAIASNKGALTVYTAQAFPREHKDTLGNLQFDRAAYESRGGGRIQAFEAIDPVV